MQITLAQKLKNNEVFQRAWTRELLTTVEIGRAATYIILAKWLFPTRICMSREYTYNYRNVGEWEALYRVTVNIQETEQSQLGERRSAYLCKWMRASDS